MKKIVIIIILLIIFAGITVAYFRPGDKLPKAVAVDTTNQPVMGQKNAKIHIVAFEDLKCIACAHFNNTVLPKLKKNYIKTGIADYTMINLAFIPGSMPAANAARCIYQQNPKLFFPFVEYTYQNQPPENEDWATIPKLVEFASHIPGVEQEKLSQCIFDSPHTNFIENNFALAKKILGDEVPTPSVFVNGVLVRPANYEDLEKVIKKLK